MLFWGCQYISGNINPYIMSYFAQFDPSINNTSVFFLLPLQAIGMTVVFPLGCFLSKYLNGRI